MKRLALAATVAGLLLLPGVARAGAATDAALGLGAFAVFNQILSGTGVFGGVAAPTPVYAAPPPPVYAAPAPVYVVPPPPMYAPAPVYVAPPPVVYAPAPPVYYGHRVYYAPRPSWTPPGHRRDHRWDHRGDHRH